MGVGCHRATGRDPYAVAQEARDLAAVLRTGSCPLPLRLVEERYVERGSGQ